MTGRTLTATASTRTPEALVRAIAYAMHRGIEVRQIDATTWEATSGSDPDTTYRLTLNEDGAIVCHCPAASFGNLCSHVGALAMRIAGVTP
jgi:hypothetical protein